MCSGNRDVDACIPRQNSEKALVNLVVRVKDEIQESENNSKSNDLAESPTKKQRFTSPQQKTPSRDALKRQVVEKPLFSPSSDPVEQSLTPLGLWTRLHNKGDRVNMFGSFLRSFNLKEGEKIDVTAGDAFAKGGPAMTKKGADIFYLKPDENGTFKAFHAYLTWNGSFTNVTPAELKADGSTRYVFSHHVGNRIFVREDHQGGHKGVVLGQDSYLVGTLSFASQESKTAHQGLRIHKFWNDSGTYQPTNDQFKKYIEKTNFVSLPDGFVPYIPGTSK